MGAKILPLILIGLFSMILSSTSSDAQVITTSCSSSMISSFSPCLSFITGSTGGGGSPTRICCDALKSLMLNNMDCACLIVTGNVPVSIPFFNANLGSALPKACKTSIPLQCKSSGVPLPAPGPVLFAPPPPPAPIPAHVPAPAPAPTPTPVHAHSPKGSKAATAAASPQDGRSDIAPAPPKFPLGPSANPGIRPVVNPKSSASNLFTVSLPYIALAVAGLIGFKLF